VAVVAAGAEDDVVIDITMSEGRICLTEDHDFGQLVYAVAKPTQGAILNRTRAPIS
jgi:predicted nuclease of predicted toxin-antitoxin system